MFDDGDPKIVVKQVLSSGDLVAAETEAMGTLSNGSRYHNRYAWIIEIKDDGCHLRGYMDTAYIMSVVECLTRPRTDPDDSFVLLRTRHARPDSPRHGAPTRHSVEGRDLGGLPDHPRRRGEH